MHFGISRAGTESFELTCAGLKNASLPCCRIEALPSVRTSKPSGTSLWTELQALETFADAKFPLTSLPQELVTRVAPEKSISQTSMYTGNYLPMV